MRPSRTAAASWSAAGADRGKSSAPAAAEGTSNSLYPPRAAPPHRPDRLPGRAVPPERLRAQLALAPATLLARTVAFVAIQVARGRRMQTPEFPR